MTQPCIRSFPCKLALFSFLGYCFILANLQTIICHESKVDFVLQSMEESNVVQRIVKIGSDVTAQEKVLAEKWNVRLIAFKQIEVRTLLLIIVEW